MIPTGRFATLGSLESSASISQPPAEVPGVHPLRREFAFTPVRPHLCRPGISGWSFVRPDPTQRSSQRTPRLFCGLRQVELREGRMATVDRNEFLRGALAAGAASFASSVATNYIAHLEPSPALHELANVMRLLDAASDRLVGALADPNGIDPAVVAALENIKQKAETIAVRVVTALPLG